MADAAHSHHTPGEPPAIRDEAADTPMWLPMLGIALLLLFAAYAVYSAVSERQAADEAAEAAQEGEAAEGEAPADPAPAPH